MQVLYRIASSVTGGEIPCVFSRGNHDLRGHLAERLEQFTPNSFGRSYFTFRVGCIWGIVLDCGEDKDDGHAEYGHTVCCHAFRQRETEFLRQVIAHAGEEYAAENVKYRLVLAHNPFTNTFNEPFDIEFDLYGEWVRLLREHVKPHLMLCGHTHIADVWMPDSEQDAHGQTWPVVISSVPNKPAVTFIGASVTLGEGEATVEFIDNTANSCGKQALEL